MKNRHTSLCCGSVLHSCTRSPYPVDYIATNLLSSLCYNIPGGLSVGIEIFGHNVVYSAEKEKTYSVLVYKKIERSLFCTLYDLRQKGCVIAIRLCLTSNRDCVTVVRRKNRTDT